MEKKLLPSHPLAKKAEDLDRYMRNNGISIARSYEGLCIVDTNTGATVHVKDSGSGTNEDCFPTTFEYNLIVED